MSFKLGFDNETFSQSYERIEINSSLITLTHDRACHGAASEASYVDRLILFYRLISDFSLQSKTQSSVSTCYTVSDCILSNGLNRRPLSPLVSTLARTFVSEREEGGRDMGRRGGEGGGRRWGGGRREVTSPRTLLSSSHDTRTDVNTADPLRLRISTRSLHLACV